MMNLSDADLETPDWDKSPMEQVKLLACQYLTAIMMEVASSKNEKVMQSGKHHPSAYPPSDHHCHMFRAEELKADLLQCGFKILTLSASNCISAMRGDDLAEMQQTPEKWAYFLGLEIRACQSLGMIESGTHLIAVVQKAPIDD
ncbi:MAG: hypothetical protein AAGM67_12070 [Bacteroidota bacterium]